MLARTERRSLASSPPLHFSREASHTPKQRKTIMKSAHLVHVPDSISRGIDALARADHSVNASTYLAQPTESASLLNAGIQGKQNSEIRPVVVKKTDFKDLKSGADYRYPQKDTAESSLEKISNDSGPRG
jgi:hypothetical protein